MWPFKKNEYPSHFEYGHIYGSACTNCGAPTEHLTDGFLCPDCEEKKARQEVKGMKVKCKTPGCNEEIEIDVSDQKDTPVIGIFDKDTAFGQYCGKCINAGLLWGLERWIDAGHPGRST